MSDPPSDEIQMTTAQVKEALHQFHQLYGATLAEWSRLEGQLFYWFQVLTGMNEKIARGIFFSARTFNGRADMLEAALDATHPDGPLRAFLIAVLKRARGYSGFRNAATHGEAHINLQRGSPAAGQMVIIQGRKVSEEAEETMITMQDLAAAQKKFSVLANNTFSALPRQGIPHTPALLQTCRELVLQLPSQAHSTEADRTPSAPEPPPKS